MTYQRILDAFIDLRDEIDAFESAGGSQHSFDQAQIHRLQVTLENAERILEFLHGKGKDPQFRDAIPRRPLSAIPSRRSAP